MPPPTLTRRLMIDGRVQGVGFRWALSAEATALGLKGWVRNRRDGTVEALIHGTPDGVEALTVWAWHGPSSARVDRGAIIPARTGVPSSGFQKFQEVFQSISLYSRRFTSFSLSLSLSLLTSLIRDVTVGAKMNPIVD